MTNEIYDEEVAADLRKIDVYKPKNLLYNVLDNILELEYILKYTKEVKP